ncbi:MAG TPA: hypothetical protein EYG03_24130 [Planctomycetes bacterium]|nr:hypothetical protein [Fuerstiella sp.]HIK95044.1 hypothetical protein [Planctomycetota bacterium]
MEDRGKESESGNDQTREKVIVHLAYPLWRKHTLIAVARAKELQDDGADVLVTYCDSRGGTCAVNYCGSRVTCHICRNNARQTAEDAGLKTIPLRLPPADSSTDPQPPWHELKDLAEGVQSGVTTTFRQLQGDSSRNMLVKGIKKRYFRTTLRLLQSMKSVLKRVRPARIEVFNGRHACSRFCLIAARAEGIAFNTLEVTTRIKPIVFQGHTAHDRLKIQQRMLTHAADFEVAKEYFDDRRRPSTNKYAKKHAAAFEPPRSDEFRKKVSIFLSSQDEFESLGQEWKSPFPDYASVIDQACREYPEYLFCIRFHPNQADMASDITTPFAGVNSLPNTVVYYPTDTANTYTLIEWSDVVVTFGSTVTVEACWMGKPAIMLGPSFFDQLDISYNPSTSVEFLRLLGQDLAPKDPQNAARVASFEVFDFDPMRYVGHNGKTLVPNGIRLYRPWLSRIARTSENVFCRMVKTCAWLSNKYRQRAA